MVVHLLSFDSRMRCYCCRAQFTLTSLQKGFIGLMFSFFAYLSVYLFFYFQSWIISLSIALIAPGLINFFIIKYANLKLVGLKAEMKKKGL